MADYTRAGRLHMGYSFELLTDDFSASYIRETVQTLEAQMTEGWPCWAISNHDVERVLTRWGRGQSSAPLANLLTAMVCSLRGSVCVYQDRKSVVQGKSVSVSVDLGGRRIIKKKTLKN